ncbi:MAG TPA: hypothetical protein VKQ36_02655 [Ktedonobacterales bacterium]|nr:hypothetical protein [Ktedonobacterales bacterium]
MKRIMGRQTSMGLIVLALLGLAAAFVGAPMIQAAPASSGPQYVTINGHLAMIPLGSKPDVVAWYKNDLQPVLVPSGKLTPSSLGTIATERGPDMVLPDCLQPPAHLDLLHTSPKLLQEYGIAPLSPGEPITKWLALYSHVKHHVCASYHTNATPMTMPRLGVSVEIKNYGGWAGKVADYNCVATQGISCNDGSHAYIETDSDYYASCESYTSQVKSFSNVGIWSGLGGVGNGSVLEQDGVSLQYVNLGGGFGAQRTEAFYESVPGNGANYLNLAEWPMACGDHMYTKEYQGDCSVIIDLDVGWTWDYCTGPSAWVNSAELIVENAGQVDGYGVPNGVDPTFYGAGVTDEFESPSYNGYGTQQHDYFNDYMDGFASNDKVLNTGPIHNDPGDVPYDEYTVSQVSPCGGYSSC